VNDEFAGDSSKYLCIVHTHIHTHTHTHIHTHSLSHSHTHTHAHTQTHYYTQVWVNDEFVGTIADIVGPCRFGMQMLTREDAVSVQRESNVTFTSLLRAAQGARESEARVSRSSFHAGRRGLQGLQGYDMALLQCPFRPSLLLHVLPHASLLTLSQDGLLRRLQPHAVVFYQGEGARRLSEPGRRLQSRSQTHSLPPVPDLPFFLVLSGHLRVVSKQQPRPGAAEANDEEEEVWEDICMVGEGEVIGEEHVLWTEARAFALIAASPASVVAFSRSLVQPLLDSAEVTHELQDLLEERLYLVEEALLEMHGTREDGKSGKEMEQEEASLLLEQAQLQQRRSTLATSR